MTDSNKKKFNLLQYVYGRLFAEQCLTQKAEGLLIDKTTKIYSWQGILYWLKKEGYIFGFAIRNVDETNSVIAYKFNRQQTMYEYYTKGIERNLQKNQLNITPMRELIEQKAFDDFEAQYKLPVEYIARIDRCVADLNQQITEELEKASKQDKKENAA